MARLPCDLPALVCCVARIVLGWALRLHALDRGSLWADEGWTLVLTEGPGLDVGVTRRWRRTCSLRCSLWHFAFGERDRRERARAAYSACSSVSSASPRSIRWAWPVLATDRAAGCLVLALAVLPIDFWRRKCAFGDGDARECSSVSMCECGAGTRAAGSVMCWHRCVALHDYLGEFVLLRRACTSYSLRAGQACGGRVISLRPVGLASCPGCRVSIRPRPLG
jgi:hypothetical protein